MTLGKYDYYSPTQDSQSQAMQDSCKRYLYHHVILTMKDGSFFDGIIESADTDRVTVLVGEDAMERENEYVERQYAAPPFGYGTPRRRFRRFRRQDFPLAALAALALLPYIAPPPYPYPYPYSYPAPYPYY